MVSHANRVALGLTVAVALVAAGVVGASTQGTLFGTSGSDADATRDAFKRHVHATAGEDLADVAIILEDMPGILADAPEWRDALISHAITLRNAREYLALPGDATDPAVLAALGELGGALGVAHDAVALEVADAAVDAALVDAGRHLGVLGERLEAGTDAASAAADVRASAAALNEASLGTLGASVDLVSVTLADTADGPVLELTVRGELPAASGWPLALVDVCLDARMPGEGDVDAQECVTTSDARESGFSVVDARRTSASTMEVTLPAAFADAETLHVRTLAQSDFQSVEDRCALDVAGGTCADETEGDVTGSGATGREGKPQLTT